MSLEPLDLLHGGAERVIASYLLETEDGPALFDCGPTSCAETLKRRLAERGLALVDVRHLLLSHIHLDHAGAAGVLVREHPALQVHVSPVGAPHLVDPGKLERSARRLYGDAFDSLWGELAPVPEANVHEVGDRVLGLDCFPSTGHASHHVCYQADDGTVYAGDAAGVRLLPGRQVLPVCPPPDIDVEAWERTIDELERRAPARLVLTHFGVADDVPRHLAELRARLRLWTEWARMQDEAEWIAHADAELVRDEGLEARRYQRAAPLWQCYAGLRRYWEKRDESDRAR